MIYNWPRVRNLVGHCRKIISELNFTIIEGYSQASYLSIQIFVLFHHWHDTMTIIKFDHTVRCRPLFFLNMANEFEDSWVGNFDFRIQLAVPAFHVVRCSKIEVHIAVPCYRGEASSHPCPMEITLQAINEGPGWASVRGKFYLKISKA